ncbi:hypothetical protein MLD38_023102 [Melastoma candidum]|uniref:Uncharacterized protein n=1 Tax=Melastoma candidum TaxID=119954 RepID=A0ACB9QPH7_9MYRT|nr:hypothetical protein MLD38_023102 [Melastoma candidum]
MCTAASLWRAHPICQLYLLHNRDEYRQSPADPLQLWGDRGILGGRDGQAGGTWPACSRRGRVAFVTNVRDVGWEVRSPQEQGRPPCAVPREQAESF